MLLLMPESYGIAAELARELQAHNDPMTSNMEHLGINIKHYEPLNEDHNRN